jgi:hypothetical protein
MYALVSEYIGNAPGAILGGGGATGAGVSLSMVTPPAAGVATPLINTGGAPDTAPAG